ncbi:MAG: extracellular solute-binding protein, partial [Actinomycetia bacterium]|nr:extracellular solute-binding protein [Actinomycetes bacterium]
TEGATYWVEKAGITPSGELTIYSYKDEGVTEWLIAEKFMEAYPDVTVNWISIPGAEYAAKIALECETNTAAFDCFWSYPAWTTQFAQYLEDITNRIPKELKDDVLPSVIASTGYNGSWFGIPLFDNIMSICYNKDILAEAGYDKPPETWDEFFECAEACTTDEDNDGIPEIYGLGHTVNGVFGYFNSFGYILGSVGGSFWNNDADNPQAMFNTAEGIRTLQILKKTFMSDFSDPVMATGDSVAVRRLLASGLAAMGIAVPGSIDAIAGADFPENIGKFDHSLSPYDPGYESTSTGGGMGFVIRKGGNVDAALAYTLFYSSPEMQKFMTKDYGFPPTRASLGVDEEFIAEYPFVLAAAEQSKYKAIRYFEANASIMQDTLFPIFESYLGGNIDEQAALDKLEEAFYAAWEE